MNEIIDGYRRTSVKTRDQNKLKLKLGEFENQGEKTKVYQQNGVFYIYVKIEKPLTALDAAPVTEWIPDADNTN